jgi:hypothetical protein
VFDNPVPLQPAGISPAVGLGNVGKESGWPVYVGKDLTIIDLQKKRDDFVAAQQKKDAELEQKRREIDATSDKVKKSELTAEAAQLKVESSQAELQATVLNNEIRNKLLIDTHVEEPPPAPGEQKTPPPAKDEKTE